MINQFVFGATASGITLGLFLLMAWLIEPRVEPPQEEPEETRITITRQEREEFQPPPDSSPPPTPEKMEEPPPPPMRRTSPTLIDAGGMSFTLPGPTNPAGAGVMTDPNSRRATPTVRIPPEYPQGPLRRGIEGWVLVEFTITEAGTVEQVRVLESEPNRVFNSASIRAIKRWKYQPKLQNGRPVAQHNMRETIRFQIKDAQ